MALHFSFLQWELDTLSFKHVNFFQKVPIFITSVHFLSLCTREKPVCHLNPAATYSWVLPVINFLPFFMRRIHYSCSIQIALARTVWKVDYASKLNFIKWLLIKRNKGNQLAMFNQPCFHFRDWFHPQHGCLLGVAWIGFNLTFPNVFLRKKAAYWINDMDG